jgi:hypothetical protein
MVNLSVYLACVISLIIISVILYFLCRPKRIQKKDLISNGAIQAFKNLKYELQEIVLLLQKKQELESKEIIDPMPVIMKTIKIEQLHVLAKQFDVATGTDQGTAFFNYIYIDLYKAGIIQ